MLQYKCTFETIVITFTQKQIEIITIVALQSSISSGDIKTYSRATFAREIKLLLQNNILQKKGSGPSTLYTKGVCFYAAPIDTDRYFKIDQEKRLIESPVEFLFFKTHESIFNTQEVELLTGCTNIWRDKIKTSTPTTKQKEFERITTELSWKSSQIEGNTYSLLDTERLLKEGARAPGHSDDEAVMILNHKKALEYIVSHAGFFKTINTKNLQEVHSLLVKGLGVETGLRKSGVGILGTNYLPQDNIYQIQDQLNSFFTLIDTTIDIPTKALFALVCVAYIQPFADGNKRTSRMLANACLLAGGYPILSFRSIDEVEYKKAILLVYEQHNISYIKKLFIDQYKHACTEYFG